MQIPRWGSLLTIFSGGFLLMALVDAFYFHPEIILGAWFLVLPVVMGLLTLMMPFPSLHAGLDAWVAEDAEPLPEPEPEPQGRSFSYSFVMLRVWLVNGTQWIWNVTRGLKVPAVRSGLRVMLLPYLLMITAGLFAFSLLVPLLGWDRPRVHRSSGGKHGRRRSSPFRHRRPPPSFDSDDGDDWVDEEPVRDSRVSYGAKALPERLIAVCYQQPGFVEVRDDRGGVLFQVTGAELLGYTARTVTVRMGSSVQTMDQRGRMVMSRVEG